MKLFNTLLLSLLITLCYGQNSTVSLNETQLIQKLSSINKISRSEIDLPIANEEFETFQLKQIKTSLHPDLQKRYPHIKSYYGKSADENQKAVITTNGKRIFGNIIKGNKIIRFQNGSNELNNKYQFENYSTENIEKQCNHPSHDIPFNKGKKVKPNHYKSGASGSHADTLNSFVIAVTFSGAQAELSGISNDDAAALAIIENNISSANLCFRNELQIEFTIHPNTDELFYYDPNTDPYGYGNTNQFLGLHNDTVAAILGESTYDLALLLHPGTGLGWAGGRLCANTKGKVATTNNVGLHRHEIGHMLSGPHTYDWDKSDEIAILGGSMIGVGNTKYTHPYNWDKLRELIETNVATYGCGTATATGNTAPVVDISGIDGVTIPANTPYVLTGTATDPDIDADLTYSWYHMKTGDADTNKLLFAHENPTDTGHTRYIPYLSAQQQNMNDPYSILSDVERDIIVRMVARDNQLPVGGYSYEEATIGVDPSAGPFLVTYPNNTELFSGNQDITVTWDVANTDNANVNALNVEISLSTDGGENFTTLLASTPNDGSQVITLPNTPSDSCRIKVQPVGNIFFDISDVDFEIVDAAVSDFKMIVQDTSISVYQKDVAKYAIGTYFLGSFTGPLDVDVSGLPAGASHNLPAQFSSNNTDTLRISNLNAVAVGFYPFTITLTENGTSNSKTYNFLLMNQEVGDNDLGGVLTLDADNKEYLEADWPGMYTSDFTVTAWIKVDTLTGNTQGIVSFGDDDQFSLLLINGSQKIRYAMPGTNSNFWATKDGGDITLGEWNHVAVVITLSGNSMYVNGRHCYSNYGDEHPLTRFAGKLRVGIFKDNTSRTFNGLIDEVRVYDRALSDEEMYELVHSNALTNDPNLISYYQFNEGSSTALDKRSGAYANFINGGSVIQAATEPTAAAAVESQLQASSINFSNTGVGMALNTVDASRTITTHYFDFEPNTYDGLGTDDVVFSQEYWEINDYPDEDILDASSITFNVSTDITTALASDFVSFVLYHRAQNSDTTWQSIAVATNADDALDQVTFPSINVGGQFFVARSSAPLVSHAAVDTTFDCTLVKGVTTSDYLTVNAIGSNLSSDLVVTHSNPDFSLSKNTSSGYAQSVSYSPSSGLVSNEPLYIKLNSSVQGEQVDTLIFSSTGADNDTLILTTSVLEKEGCRGNAFQFDGPNQYINIEDLAITPSRFTIEFWLKPYSNSNWNQQIGKGWGKFLFHLNNNGSVTAGVANDGTRIDTEAGIVVLNDWMHIAYTYDNGETVLYINGEEKGTSSGVPIPNSWNNFRIGNNSTGNTIDGEIDEFRIWLKPRTQTEVQTYMNEIYPIANNCDDSLLVYYQFEEIDGGILNNIAGTSQDGTVINSPVVITSTAPVDCQQTPTGILWDGEGLDNLWSTATNWNTDAVPNKNDTVTLDHTYVSGAYNVLMNVSDSVHLLSISEPSIKLVIDEGKTLVYDSIAATGTVVVRNNASLIPKTYDSGNVSGNFIVKRDKPNLFDFYNFWSSPVQNGHTDMLVGGEYIFTMQNGSGNDVSFYESAEGNMEVGRGYTAIRVDSAYFTGPVNNGTITYGIEENTGTGGGPFNLVGNPYPSAINALEFADENSGVLDEATIYIYNQKEATTGQNSYANFMAINGTGSSLWDQNAIIDTFDIASCQGFGVVAAMDNDITFTNSMRDSTNNNTFKSGNKVELNNAEYYWFNLVNESQEEESMLIAFGEQATDKKDYYYDASTMVSETENQLASMIKNELFMINAYPLIESIKIPLSLTMINESSTSKTFDFKMVRTKQAPQDVEVYLLDTLTNSTFDLTNGDVFSFTSDTSTFIQKRYQLHFVRESSVGIVDNQKEQRSTVNWYTKNDRLFINSVSKKSTNLKLYTVGGKLISEFNLKPNGTKTFHDLSHGIYILKYGSDSSYRSLKISH